MEEHDRDRIVRVVNDVLTKLRHGKSLPDTWLRILDGCLQEKTYEEIDSLVQFGSGSSKDAANRNLWPPLTEILGAKIGKKNCINLLQIKLAELEAFAYGVMDTTEANGDTQHSGGGILHFPGPDNGEVNQSRWTRPLPHNQEVAVKTIVGKVRQGHHLIILNGLPNTGKTLLVRHLMEAMSADFDQVLRYPANSVRTLESLSLKVSSEVKETELNGHNRERSAQENLDNVLRHQRILIGITDADNLYRQRNLAGCFNESAKGYELWLLGLITAPTTWQGCLIWSSQAPPLCLSNLTQSSNMVCQYTFPTLDNINIAAWARNYQRPATDAWEELVQFCAGHQEWIQLSLRFVEREYRGEIQPFLASPQLWDSKLHESLQKVTSEEKDILTWVVLRKLTPAFLSDLLPETTVRNQAISSLERRGLLQWGALCESYQLTAKALRYILAAFIVNELKQEFSNGKFERLHRYPLLLVEAPAYQQSWHRRYLLQPLTAHLQGQYPNSDSQRSWLVQTLAEVRTKVSPQMDYGVSNLLNIAAFWGLSLADYDLSGLSLDHVDLRNVNLGSLKLQGCHFSNDIAWPIFLQSPLQCGLSPSGKLVAVSDRSGFLLVWRQESDKPIWKLMDCIACSMTIQAFVVVEDMVIFAVADQVYCWWPDENQPITELHELEHYKFSGMIDALAIAPTEPPTQIAVATSNGEITLLNLFTEERSQIRAYSSQLSFSLDGARLASLGLDNNIRCWSVVNDELCPIPTESPEQSFEGVFIGFGWQGQSLCAAEALDAPEQMRLHFSGREPWAVQPELWIEMIFSGNGQWIAGKSQSGPVEILNIQQKQDNYPKATIRSETYPVQMTHQGDLVLLQSEEKIQLWDTQSQKCLWEITAAPSEGFITNIDWKNVTGLPQAEQKLWHLQITTTTDSHE